MPLNTIFKQDMISFNDTHPSSRRCFFTYKRMYRLINERTTR
ncbi:hypothetical protein BRARA_H00995 [Brassica rapa]|uniref:Uncharacterized protein n=1 Tax=Brassica campestris TaxID=3711 RepID=A0A397Y9V2_BRACM|nr:hypothetical protein BRARA_H00995 [Brassica rapa]